MKPSKGSFRDQAHDSERRPLLKQQALLELEQANEQMAQLQQARQHVPPDSHLELEWLDQRYKANWARTEAQVRLKIIEELETPAADRWRKVADDWLAVFAVWTLGFYGVGWGFIVLAGTGPGAALMVLLKAVAIAISLTLIGTRITALVARLARRWQRRQR